MQFHPVPVVTSQWHRGQFPIRDPDAQRIVVPRPTMHPMQAGQVRLEPTSSTLITCLRIWRLGFESLAARPFQQVRLGMSRRAGMSVETI